MNYIIAIIILGILYGFYFLLTEGKPVKMTRISKELRDEFNQRYEKGFYNDPK